MPFPKLVVAKYPPRFWSAAGYPGVGKSTFAARMRGPQLIVDADHRYMEVAHLTGEVYQISTQPADNVDPDRIATLLNQNMAGAQIGTIIVDSLTAIITPLVVQAMADKEHGRTKNLMAGFSVKALAMRQLQDAVTRWATDVLWLYHTYDARNESAEKLTRASLSVSEVVRLMRSLNLHLELVRDEKTGKRGVKVVWARRGRAGMTLWDETGTWEGMPARIEAAVYDGLSPEEQDRIEMSAPEIFTSPELALTWAIEQGAFTEVVHAKHAYEKVKREGNPQNARAMTALWVAEVQKRLPQKEPAPSD